MHYLPPIIGQYQANILEPQPANATVIWLHGLGADGYDFEPMIQELKIPQLRFVLPHAPEMPVTLNNGYVMPAWYDLYGLTPGTEEDALGIAGSQRYIEELIAQALAQGIKPERVVLAGFSQGGAIALHTALRYAQPLAGILALSTYLPLKAQLVHEASESNRHTPIFMAHGTQDSVITLATNDLSKDFLLKAGYAVQFKAYDMAHSLCAQEISDIRAFLQQVLVE